MIERMLRKSSPFGTNTTTPQVIVRATTQSEAYLEGGALLVESLESVDVTLPSRS